MKKFSLEKDKLLFLFLLTDLVFLILHILYVYTGRLPTSYFSLTRDRSYAEFFQYTKELWIAALFFFLWLKYGKALHIVFAAVFTWFLADDSLTLHENLGEWLADTFAFQPIFGLRPLDLGELLVYAFFGGLLLAAVTLAYLMADVPLRATARKIFVLLAFLFGFGVILDMVEITLQVEWISNIFKMLEESGEMVVMSVIVWTVYNLETPTTASTPSNTSP